VRPHLEACDKRLAEVFDHLYELTIDQGAHPNPLGVYGSAKTEESDDELRFVQIYLHADGIALDAGLKTLVEAGIFCLYTLQHVPALRTRFELLGVKDRLNALKSASTKLVKRPEP
jgi:hypothetical protein